MDKYIDAYDKTCGAGNRYRAMEGFEFSTGEALDWVGGKLPTLPEKVISYLLSHGLAEDKTFLDIGCGPLRCSKDIILHLNEGNYFGIDGDPNLLKIAYQRLTKAELAKKPVLKNSWEFEFDLFAQPHFDIIFSQGVICHMPNEEIVKMLSKIKEFLGEDGQAHLSYIEGKDKDVHQGVFKQTFEELKTLASTVGLKATDEGEWGHPRNLKMISLTHEASR